jgi:hypothetical protein
MKAIAVSLISAAMLVCGLSAFAYSMTPNTTEQNLQAYRHWIGRSTAQMSATLGKPSYTSTDKAGRRVYDYVVEPQHVGPVPTYQFAIGTGGKVSSASLSF